MSEPVPETVFAREHRWFPRVVRQGGELRLALAAGANANHDPRTFDLPIRPEHLAAIRGDLTRHLLLWSALLPLCDAAGTRGPLDEAAAVDLLDPVLLSPPEQVQAHFTRTRWDRRLLIAHGADIDLLDEGRIVDSLRSATESSDWLRVQEHDATRRRAARGVVLTPLDEAVLRFTGQYLHGSTLPRRLPDAVTPALLPDVQRVLATAERAAEGSTIGPDPRRGRRGTDSGDWDRMSAVIGSALRRERAHLADDAVRSLTFLLCSEAAAVARGTSAAPGRTSPGSG